MLSLSSNHIAYICAVTVFAYSLRGATGFGAAAAIPLMGLVPRAGVDGAEPLRTLRSRHPPGTEAIWG
jgi:hypothetical protein